MTFLHRILARRNLSGAIPSNVEIPVLSEQETAQVREVCEGLARVYGSVGDTSLKLSESTKQTKHAIVNESSITSLVIPYAKFQARSELPLPRAAIPDIFHGSSRFSQALSKIDRLTRNCLHHTRLLPEGDAKEALTSSVANLIYHRIALGGMPSKLAQGSMATSLNLSMSDPNFVGIMEEAAVHAKHVFGERSLMERSGEILRQFGRGKG